MFSWLQKSGTPSSAGEIPWMTCSICFRRYPAAMPAAGDAVCPTCKEQLVSQKSAAEY